MTHVEQEARLTYRREVHRWEGNDAVVSVVANPDALSRKISTYLEEQGVAEPTLEDRNRAMAVVSSIAYWHNYQGSGEGISVHHKDAERGRDAER